jgi:carbamoyl-phosphate synthase large subunit
MGELWIGVTGFHATDNPYPGLAVIRSLRRADPSWRVLAFPWDLHGTGAFAAGLIDAHALVPMPRAGASALLERVTEIVQRHPLHVIIPTVDSELPQYVALQGALKRMGIRTLLPTPAALRAREKRCLPELAVRAGILVPDTVVLESPEAVWQASVTCRYPQVVKGMVVDTAVAHSPEDFRVAARVLSSQWGYPILAQPLIPGEEYDVAAVARRGELVAVTVMKKLSVTSKGTAWAGVTVEEPDLIERTARLVRALRWDGAIEAEFLRAMDGRVFCFEVNARFPSWIALAAEAGSNLPAILVRVARHEAVESSRSTTGRLFARAVVEHVFDRNPLADLTGNGIGSDLLAAHADGQRRPLPARRPGVAGTVAITGLNAGDNPSPGLTVARALRMTSPPPRLVGLSHEVLATAAYVDGLWDEVRLLPFPSPDGGYLEALIDHCRAARVDCLMPTLDIEIPTVASAAAELRRAGIATLVPSMDALRAVAKTMLPGLAKHGFTLPRTEIVSHFGDLPRVGHTLGLPFVLKGARADARVVDSDEEALVVAGRLAAIWGFPLIAQALVRGQERSVMAVADRRHRLVGAVVVRKEIQTLNGNTWSGTIVHDRALSALAARFATALGWVGPFEMEFIRDPASGPVLIEINPRWPGWALASAGAGTNLPWAAVRLARGKRVSLPRPRAGTFYVRMAWDTTAAVERMGALLVEGRVGGHVA